MSVPSSQPLFANMIFLEIFFLILSPSRCLIHCVSKETGKKFFIILCMFSSQASSSSYMLHTSLFSLPFAFPVIFRIISHPSLSLLSQEMRGTLWSPSTSWWMSWMDFQEELRVSLLLLLCIFFLLHQLLVWRWERKLIPTEWTTRGRMRKIKEDKGRHKWSHEGREDDDEKTYNRVRGEARTIQTLFTERKWKRKERRNERKLQTEQM